ncbi:hypothetical protein Lser_V15G06588 [Lactuca serriola]
MRIPTVAGEEPQVQEMRRAEVAIIATPSMGNLIPAVEFATHLINHHPSRISVVILAISMPQRPILDDYIQSRIANKQIRFIQLHHVDSPLPDQYSSGIEFISRYIENHKPIIKQTLNNLRTTVFPYSH